MTKTIKIYERKVWLDREEPVVEFGLQNNCVCMDLYCSICGEYYGLDVPYTPGAKDADGNIYDICWECVGINYRVYREWLEEQQWYDSIAAEEYAEQAEEKEIEL